MRAEYEPCRLCGGSTRLLFEKSVLGRHRVGYRQCTACGLTQTSQPTWLAEAYADAIHPTDTGLLARNLAARRIAATFLHLAGVRDQPCLDYAAGYGVFVRLMRDAGFRYYWSDPHAQNLFAQGFEWNETLGPPIACTAFEVLEHFVHPREEFARLAGHGADFLITSTELPPGGVPSPDWHYLSIESGQHVAFYRGDTLERLGREHGYPHVLAGPFYQLFARRPGPAWRWRLAVRLGTIMFPVVRRLRPSFTQSDCAGLRNALRRL
jgi:hypothetical protein